MSVGLLDFGAELGAAQEGQLVLFQDAFALDEKGAADELGNVAGFFDAHRALDGGALRFRESEGEAQAGQLLSHRLYCPTFRAVR